MNNAYLSLEQEFALRILSIQVQQNTDVVKLQEELINLFEKILIKHQSLQDIYSFSVEQQEQIALYLRANQTFVLGLEAEATMISSCINSIKKKNDTEELQALLIEANEIYMIQKNYSDFISQYISK